MPTMKRPYRVWIFLLAPLAIAASRGGAGVDAPVGVALPPPTPAPPVPPPESDILGDPEIETTGLAVYQVINIAPALEAGLTGADQIVGIVDTGNEGAGVHNALALAAATESVIADRTLIVGAANNAGTMLTEFPNHAGDRASSRRLRWIQALRRSLRLIVFSKIKRVLHQQNIGSVCHKINPSCQPITHKNEIKTVFEECWIAL